MVFLFVLLVPVAMILRSNGERHVSTNGLPGAAAVIEPGVDTTETVASAVTTAPAAPTVVTYPVIDPATGKPVVATAAATRSAAAASAVGASASATNPGQRSKATQSASGSSNDSSSQQQTATSRAKRTTTTADQPDTTAKRKRTTTTVKPKRVSPTTKPKRTTTTTKPKPKVNPPSPPRIYTPAQAEAIIRYVWPDSVEDKAVAIATRESSLHANVRNWCCYGLFQIHFNANKKVLAQIGVTSANQLFDPWVNARAALVMYMRSGWGPWGG
jgi:hypothetical protein